VKTRWISAPGILLAVTLPVLQVGSASAQDIRVFLIRSPDVKAIPPDAWQTFHRAIREAAPDVRLVPSAALATGLVELMRYEWDPGNELGVTQKWQFFYTPLPKPDGLGRTPARPTTHLLIAPGKTLAESTEVSARRLRMTLRQMFLGIEPAAPRRE
jgi:hypothetical protein